MTESEFAEMYGYEQELDYTKMCSRRLTMTTADKRSPCLTDTDEMPFGKHKGEQMQDVPAKYLAWLWGEMGSDVSANVDETKWAVLPEHSRNAVRVANYIFNSKKAIEQEIGEKI